MECSIINPAISLLMKYLVIGQHHKAPNFSAFHWSPHGSLVSIGQHFITTRVIHLPKRTETSLIKESDKWTESVNGTRLCWPCIAAIAGSNQVEKLIPFTSYFYGEPYKYSLNNLGETFGKLIMYFK